ncbi:unnamed protein product [Urochloa humidicola]
MPRLGRSLPLRIRIPSHPIGRRKQTAAAGGKTARQAEAVTSAAPPLPTTSEQQQSRWLRRWPAGGSDRLIGDGDESEERSIGLATSCLQI